MQGAVVEQTVALGGMDAGQGTWPPSGHPFLPLENGVGDRDDRKAQAWEENRDERVCVEGWVIKLLGEQWWGGRESDQLLLQGERMSGEKTGWAEQDGIEKMYGAGAMWEQSQRVWE
jgi:hypothetical protein